MESKIADKELSDGSTVTLIHVEGGIYEGSMLTIKNKGGVSARFLPNILEQKNTTAGQIFKELEDTDTFESACDKIESL